MVCCVCVCKMGNAYDKQHSFEISISVILLKVHEHVVAICRLFLGNLRLAMCGSYAKPICQRGMDSLLHCLWLSRYHGPFVWSDGS